MSAPIIPGWKPSDSSLAGIDLIKSIAVSINHQIIEDWVEEDPHNLEPKSKKFCDLAIQAGMQVYSEFCFGVEALPVEFRALTEEQNQRRLAGEEYLVYVAGGGLGEPQGEWDGHIVLRVNDLIVDPSAGQGAKPVIGRMVPDSVVFSAQDLPSDNEGDKFTEIHYQEGQTVLLYRQRPENTPSTAQHIVRPSPELVTRITRRVIADIRTNPYAILPKATYGKLKTHFVPRTPARPSHPRQPPR